MEIWIIFIKLIVMLYIGLTYIQSNSLHLPWVVLALLIYFCLNITVYLFRKKGIRQAIIFTSIILTYFFQANIDPVFILLLPISIYEIAHHYVQKKRYLLLLAILPIFYINHHLYSVYGMVVLLTFLIYQMAAIFIDRLTKYENDLDKMRIELRRLSKSLNENQEYIRQSEYTYKLEERNRLSQEIHDKIGHSITGALIQMEASKSLMNLDQKKAKELLQNAINISKEGIESIRVTLKNIKPPTEQMGIHRMKLLIDDFASKHELATSFVYKGNLEIITPFQWKIIQENVTEALTNTLKYSDATRVSIDIQVLNKMIKVEIKDNGKGALKVKKGLGIRGMEERTATINGKVIVDGTNGFSVTMLLPI